MWLVAVVQCAIIISNKFFVFWLCFYVGVRLGVRGV